MKKTVIFLVTVALLSSCVKKAEEDTGGGAIPPPPPPPPTLVGSFTFKGEGNTGVSECYTDAANYTGTGKAARISVTAPGYIKFLHMGNLPATGSVTVSDKYDRLGCYSCPVIFLDYGPLPFTTDKSYESYSGTITKTSTGYSFSAQMIKTQDIGTVNPQKYSLTGTLACQ